MMSDNEVYAVVKHDRTQYFAAVGDIIDVEKTEAKEKDEYIIRDVLLIKGENGVNVGQPTIKDAYVKCIVEGQYRDKKVKIFKYKAKSRYRRRKGHRQPFTRLQVVEIGIGDKVIDKLQEKNKPKKYSQKEKKEKDASKKVTKATKNKEEVKEVKKESRKESRQAKQNVSSKPEKSKKSQK